MSNGRVLLIYLLFWSFSGVRAQQSITVPLLTKPGYGPFSHSILIGTYLADPGPEFKLNKRIKTGALWRFNFDPVQYAFSEYVKSGRSDTNFVSRMHRLNWDTSLLYTGSVNNFIFVYAGVDEHGNFLIIPDRNHNRDFDDDSIYIYKNAHYSREGIDSVNKLLPYETMRIQVWQTNKAHELPFFIRFLPGNLLSIKMSNPIADTGKVAIEINEYAIGRERIGGKELLFYVSSSDFPTVRAWGGNSYRIFTSDGPESEFPKAIAAFLLNKAGDSIPIGNALYKLDSVDPVNNKLTIRYAGANHGRGIQIGTVAKDFKSKDILTDKPLSLTSLAGKYVLLDFWGTWCIPCKETVPGLKDFHTKYPNLEMLSIALDDKLDVVINYLKNEEITWSNIFEDRRTTQGKIADVYNVQEYPTFILLDPKGKIIFREYGIPGFRDLEKIVPQLLSSH
jgi:thiol-disulfide isomerase/thioredoxin